LVGAGDRQKNAKYVMIAFAGTERVTPSPLHDVGPNRSIKTGFFVQYEPSA
jgi:hypothetical protein